MALRHNLRILGTCHCKAWSKDLLQDTCVCVFVCVRAIKHVNGNYRAPHAVLVSQPTQLRHETSNQLTIQSQSQWTPACHSRCQACIIGEKLDTLSTKCKELCRSRKFLNYIRVTCKLYKLKHDIARIKPLLWRSSVISFSTWPWTKAWNSTN